MTGNQCRAAFEKRYSLSTYPLDREEGKHGYIARDTNALWHGYQAGWEDSHGDVVKMFNDRRC